MLSCDVSHERDSRLLLQNFSDVFDNPNRRTDERFIVDDQLVQEIEMLYSQVCHALGDPKRLLILYALSRGARNVSELARELDVPQPTVSRHLAILRERSLVEARRDSAMVYYTLTDSRVIQALDVLRAMLRDRMLHQADLSEFRALDNSRSAE